MNEPGEVDEVQGHGMREVVAAVTLGAAAAIPAQAAGTQLSVVPTAGSLVPLGDWSLLVDVRDGAATGRVEVLDGQGRVLSTSAVVAGSVAVGVGNAAGTLTVRYDDGAHAVTQQVTLPSG